MRGVFKPREHLVERDLAERFGISRTPVREALRRLESIGMVRTIPNHGARVMDFSPRDVDALFKVRIYLEKLAVNFTCFHDDHEIIRNGVRTLRKINQQLVDAVSSDDFAEIVEFDQHFHLALLGLSQNPYLMWAIQGLRLKSYPISYYFWRSKTNLRTSLVQHRRMIKLIEKGDAAELISIIEEQLNNSKNAYLAYLRSQSHNGQA